MNALVHFHSLHKIINFLFFQFWITLLDFLLCFLYKLLNYFLLFRTALHCTVIVFLQRLKSLSIVEMIKGLWVYAGRFKQLQYLLAEHYIKSLLLQLLELDSLIEILSSYTQMFRSILQTIKAQSTFRKDLSSKYGIYDDVIKEYREVGNEISTSLMRRFILSANPKVSRQQNYMPKVAHILKSSVPHFKKNAAYYRKHQILSFILVLYQSMNIYRKQIFELVEQNCLRFEDFSILHWLQTYSCMIDLHHQGSPSFKSKVKQYLLQQLLNESFGQKYTFKATHFECALKALKFMLMDPELNIQQCQTLIDFIESKIIPSLTNVSLIDRNVGQTLALIKELIHLNQLQVNTQKFKNLLQSAIKYQISQKVQSDKSTIKQENYNISLNGSPPQENQGPIISQNTRIINHGQSSVFETIFARILGEKGYDFQKNVFIGMFEYDVLVKGKKQKIYRPFQNIKTKQFEPISAEEWNSYKSMSDFKKIEMNETFENPVVLNLNGPYHYIDSDIYGNQRVTRTEETKGKILKNYGYTNFNTVYYAKWQETHEKGIGVEEYIEEVLSKNMLTKI